MLGLALALAVPPSARADDPNPATGESRATEPGEQGPAPVASDAQESLSPDVDEEPARSPSTWRQALPAMQIADMHGRAALEAATGVADRIAQSADLPEGPTERAAALGLPADQLERRSALAERRAALVAERERTESERRQLQRLLQQSAEPLDTGRQAAHPAEHLLLPTRAIDGLTTVAQAALRLEQQQAWRDAIAAEYALVQLVRLVDLLIEELERQATARGRDTRATGARQRLQDETGVTGEVEQQAAEARRLAEEARRETLDAERRRLADILDAAGAALDTLAAERREEEARLEDLADAEESFSSFARELQRRVDSVRAAPASDPTRPERADRLFGEALGIRQQARTERNAALAEQGSVRDSLQDARAARAEALGNLELLQLDATAVDPELTLLRLTAAEAGHQVAEQQVRLRQLRVDRVEGALAFADARVAQTARWMDGVTPLLSPQERRSRFRIHRDSLVEAGQNLQDRARIWGEFATNWREHARALVNRVLSVDGVLGAGRLVVLLALLLLGLRQLRARRHGVIRAVLKRMEATEWAARHYAWILKTAELLRDLTYPTATWLIAWLLFRQLPTDLALLNLLRNATLGVLLYVVAIRAATTVLLPSASRGKNPYRGDNVADFGIDVIDIEERTAQLLVLTARILLLYLLVTSILLHTLATFTGLGLVYQSMHSLVFWGRLALLYALSWYWRDVIVDQFVQMSRLEGKPAERLLRKHKDRPYSVIVLLMLAGYVLVVETGKFARHHLVEVSLVKRFNNFIFRKRIELAQSAQSEDTDAEARGTAFDPDHPAFHEDSFCPRDEEIDRPREVERLLKALDAWSTDEDSGGAVALIGERNMGKTTILAQAHDALQARLDGSDGTTLTWLTLVERITTPADVHDLLVALFELPGSTTHDTLVHAILDGPRRLVIVDECHMLFLRRIGGFAALDTFLNVVSLTRQRVFWLLSFNLYAWRYLNRVNNRRHYFRDTLTLTGFGDAELRSLIDRRNARAGVQPDFSRLALAGARPGRHGFELVKTSEGYFRLLNEYAAGNPGIAMALWLRSLRQQPDGTAIVQLFRPPGETQLKELDDNQLFSLTAIAQHESLTAEELASVLNMPVGQALLHFNLFLEHDFIRLDGRGRARLHAVCQRQILNRLRDTNLLYLQR